MKTLYAKGATIHKCWNVAVKLLQEHIYERYFNPFDHTRCIATKLSMYFLVLTTQVKYIHYMNGLSGPGGLNIVPFLDFGEYVNPISNVGTNYAHHIRTRTPPPPTPGLSDPPTALHDTEHSMHYLLQ